MDNYSVIKKYFFGFLQVAFVLLIGLGTIWVASYITGDRNKSSEIAQQVVQQIIIKRPVCPDTSADFSNLVNEGQVITLAQDLNSYGSDGVFQNEKIVVVKRSGSGSEVACGYLYAEVSIAGRPMQEQYENIYVKPGEFGGHILDNNAIVDKSDSTKTELLFDLSNMTYREGLSTSEIETADWASLLNVSDKVSFDIGLNTTDSKGKILKLQLAYRCWNPDSGKETNDCQLSVQQ